MWCDTSTGRDPLLAKVRVPRSRAASQPGSCAVARGAVAVGWVRCDEGEGEYGEEYGGEGE